MPVRHLVVWLAAGVACWSLIGAAALWAPHALLALSALVVLPWLRTPRAVTGSGGAAPVRLAAPAVAAGAEVRDEPRVLVAQPA